MASQIYVDGWTHFGLMPRMHRAQRWTLTHLLEEMQHCSISAALVIHSRQWLYDAMRENRRLLELIEPHQQLLPIWNALPGECGDFPAPGQFVAQLRKHGVRAVTVHPKEQKWSLRSRGARELFEALRSERVLVGVSLNEQVEVAELDWLLEQFRGLRVLVRNVHWSQTRLMVPLLKAYPDLHLGFDTYQVNRGPERLVAMGLEDQLVYESNAVDMSMGAHRMYIDYAEISAQAKQKIAAGNLMRLLELAMPAERVNAEEDAHMAQARRGEPLSELVLDAHAHILDEGCHDAGQSYVMWDGGPQDVVKLARSMGVAGIGIMSWHGTVSAQGDDGNRCVSAALDAFPDFFWGLATFDVVHDSREVLQQKLEQVYADARYKGLKPYPSYNVPYDDPRYDVWWEFGQQRGLYCGLHPVNWYKPAELESVCRRFPGLKVVAFHCGGSFEIADTVIELAKRYANLWLEITLTPVWGGIIDYLVQGAGADRVMYGSDLPMRDPRQQLGWVVYSRLSVEDKRKVLGQNAQRLVGWKSSGRTASSD